MVILVVAFILQAQPDELKVSATVFKSMAECRARQMELDSIVKKSRAEVEKRYAFMHTSCIPAEVR